jgi:hypothetical protein
LDHGEAVDEEEKLRGYSVDTVHVDEYGDVEYDLKSIQELMDRGDIQALVNSKWYDAGPVKPSAPKRPVEFGSW